MVEISFVTVAQNSEAGQTEITTQGIRPIHQSGGRTKEGQNHHQREDSPHEGGSLLYLQEEGAPVETVSRKMKEVSECQIHNGRIYRGAEARGHHLH